ncbi:WD40-repeat-containing domain protein [Boletus coccyginus]|nr:WD40-repeat-containing domain protein [Boletus coccyginus]
MSSVASQWFGNDGSLPSPVISGRDHYMHWLEYLPDGQRVVTGSRDGTVQVWNLESGQQDGAPMKHQVPMTNLVVTRDGTKIVSSDEDGRIKVWDVESHKLVKEWTHPERHFKVSISPDDRLIAAGSWNVAIYTMEGGHVDSVEVGDIIWSMCFSPCGDKLACGTIFGTCVYDVNSGMLILGPLDRSVTVLWSHDGSRLFSGSVGGTICSWNSNTGQQIGHPWTGHTGTIRSLSLSPDGSILASASWDKTIRFWNATTGDPIGKHLQHNEAVYAVCLFPSGEFVALGEDGKIFLREVPCLNSVESRTGLANLDAPRNTAYCAQVSPFDPPLSYSTHTFSAERELDFALGLFPTTHPIVSSVVPSSHPNPPIPNPNPDETHFLDTSSMSNETDLRHATQKAGPSTSVFHSTSNADPKKTRKIDKIKQKLIAMLREIGFRVFKDRLPWSTLEGELEKQRYTILHWPQGVFREKDKGVYSLGAEEADKLYRALFVDERRVQFVRPDDVFRSAPNVGPKKIRKIDEIKQEIVEMLRKVGFKLSNGRLPWSTLEGDLWKKGYMIVNWPQGVVRDRDKGVSGLSAEDADKLHDALFVGEQRLQFVPFGDESAHNNDVTSLAVASGSDRPRGSNRSMLGKQPRFRVTTAEAYPHKKRRV